MKLIRYRNSLVVSEDDTPKMGGSGVLIAAGVMMYTMEYRPEILVYWFLHSYNVQKPKVKYGV